MSNPNKAVPAAADASSNQTSAPSSSSSELGELVLIGLASAALTGLISYAIASFANRRERAQLAQQAQTKPSPTPKTKSPTQPQASKAPQSAQSDAAATSPAVPAQPQKLDLPVIPGMSSDALVRKLIADPLFQLRSTSNSNGNNPTASLQSHVHKIMKRAMWDAVREELDEQAPQNAGADSLETTDAPAIIVEPTKDLQFKGTLALIGEIRDRLMSITPSRTDLHKEIHERIDVALIEQQLKHQAFGHAELAALARWVMGRVQALESPARSESTAKWLEEWLSQDTSTVDEVERFRQFADFFHEKVDSIHLDTLNYHLRTLAPVVRMHGVEYCRVAFETQFTDGKTPVLDEWMASTQKERNALIKSTGDDAAATATGDDENENENNTPSPSASSSKERQAEGERERQTREQIQIDRVQQHRAAILNYVWHDNEAKNKQTSAGAAGAAGLDHEANQLFVPEPWRAEHSVLVQLRRQADTLARTAYLVMRLRQLKLPGVTAAEGADADARQMMEHRTSALASEVYDLLLTDIPPSVVDIGTDGKISMVVMPGVGTDKDSKTSVAPVGVRLAVALVVKKVSEWGNDVHGINDLSSSDGTSSGEGGGSGVRVEVRVVDASSQEGESGATAGAGEAGTAEAAAKAKAEAELAVHVEKALSPATDDKVHQLVRKRLELLLAAIVVGTLSPSQQQEQQQGAGSGGGSLRSSSAAPKGPSELIREKLKAFSLEFMITGFTRLASGVMSFAQRDFAIHASVFAAPKLN